MRKEMLNLKNMRPINREIAGQVATLASRFDCTFERWSSPIPSST